ncbi:MAG: amidohydrolase family protein [Thermodesulfobacteriota bacterium]
MIKTCYHNLRLFDGVHPYLQEGKIIVVEDDRIKAVQDEAARDRYLDHHLVDLNGYTLLPGLIDAHVHPTVPLALKLNLKVILQMGRQVTMNFASFLKYGITTIRDLASFSSKMQSWRQKIESGSAPGPRIVTALSFLTSPGGVPEMAPTLNPVEALIAGGQFVERPREPDKVRRIAEGLIARGADWLKTQYSEESFLFHGRLNNLSDDCLRALMEVSTGRGVPVAMHHTEKAGFKKGLDLGVRTLEHCSLQELDQADVDLMVKKGISLVPTLKAIGDHADMEAVLDWLTREGRADFMPEPYRQTVAGLELMRSRPYPPPDYRKKFYPDVDMLSRGYPITLKNVARVKKAGGRIGVGTDSCGTGLSFAGQYWRELWLLTQAGFSNVEALTAATRINAGIIGLKDRVGTVEPGKYADFTVVEGNPLDDITAVKNVRTVIKGGLKVKG